jgi:hypothetical protein
MTGLREIGTVSTPGLNLRKAPGKHAAVADVLTYGDKVIVLGRQYPGGYEWLRVRVFSTKSGKGLDQEGWVFRGDVEIKVEVPDPGMTMPVPQPIDLWRVFVAAVAFVVTVLLWWAFS